MSRGLARREELGRRWSAPEVPRRTITASAQERRRLCTDGRSGSSFPGVECAFEIEGGGSGEGGREGRQLSEEWREKERHRQKRYQPRVVDVGCRDIGTSLGRGRNNLTYSRLPEQHLRIRVVKLDSSTFDVQVTRAASVLELKLAVEEVFSRLPKGEGTISWYEVFANLPESDLVIREQSIVWGHFCLCYKDQKLVDDRAYLRGFGIRDGDELHFIRHISINYNRTKQQSRRHGQKKREPVGSEIRPASEGNATDVRCDTKKNGGYSGVSNKDGGKSRDFIPPSEFKPAHSSPRWLSFSGSWLSTRAMLGSKVRLSGHDIRCPRSGEK